MGEEYGPISLADSDHHRLLAGPEFFSQVGGVAGYRALDAFHLSGRSGTLHSHPGRRGKTGKRGPARPGRGAAHPGVVLSIYSPSVSLPIPRAVPALPRGDRMPFLGGGSEGDRFFLRAGGLDRRSPGPSPKSFGDGVDSDGRETTLGFTLAGREARGSTSNHLSLL